MCASARDFRLDSVLFGSIWCSIQQRKEIQVPVSVLGSYYLLRSFLCLKHYRLKIRYLRSPAIVAPHLKKKVFVALFRYGCETWSLTLREERRLSVFENRALSIIFGIKRDEVTGEWRKLHSEELNDLYSSPTIVRVVKSKRKRCSAYGGGQRRVQDFGGKT
jgi:hypothetical protein